MTKKNTVIFVVADEAKYRGESDYMKSIAAEIKSRGREENTEYLVYKTGQSGQNGDAQVLPLNNNEYAAVPSIDTLDAGRLQNTGKLSIIGVGHSTLDAVVDLAAQTGGKAETSYITHMVDDRADLQKIVDNGITLFAPMTKKKLTSMDRSLGAKAKFIALGSVPHTNSAASCEMEYDSFIQTLSADNGPTAKKYRDVIEGDGPFAFVVLNAGFGVGEDKQHVPYTEKEAAEQGAALGQKLPPCTHLILAHGGPRSLKDQEMGQDAMKAFADAYAHAQFGKSGTHPDIICEPFKQGLPYNIIKAGYILGRKENCVAFISNSEGYGTMDGAVLHISNQDKLLGMFPFGAQYADETGQRQENIEKYNQLGVALLTVEDGALSIRKHPKQKVTPSRIEDAAQRIVQFLELAKDSVVQPSTKARVSGMKT